MLPIGHSLFYASLIDVISMHVAIKQTWQAKYLGGFGDAVNMAYADTRF